MQRTLPRIRQTCKALQTAWSILGVTLVLIVLAELLLRAGFWLKDRGRPRIPPDPRAVAAVEQGDRWLPLHYRELERLADRWSPYVYFRQRPFQGRTITIDDEGRRATWRPPDAPEGGTASPSAPPPRILMLGGSSLWGFGARDEGTIPSQIVRALHERGIRVDVENLAEIGYVNTQEVIALMRALQQGKRPDVVLFYDGVNDTTSALLEGRATLTTNEVNRRREFNLLQSPGRLTGSLLDYAVRNSASYRLAGAIARRFGDGTDPDARRPAVSDASALPRLADEVVEGYLANRALVEALGKSYGFQSLFVWQPVIFSKPRRVPFEEEESVKLGWSSALFALVHDRLRAERSLVDDRAFLDLTPLFDDTDELVFLDFCHTTEAANATIARAIVAKLLDAGAIRPAPP
jgi:hypothetical protein